MNQGAFLMRGLEKVRAEFSLTALAYNLQARPQSRRVQRVDGCSGGLKGSCLSVADACGDTISENHIVERDFSAKSTVCYDCLRCALQAVGVTNIAARRVFTRSARISKTEISLRAGGASAPIRSGEDKQAFERA